MTNSESDPAQLPRQAMSPAQVDALMRAQTAGGDPLATLSGTRPRGDTYSTLTREQYVEERIRTVLGMHGGAVVDPATHPRLRRLIQELRAEFDTLAADGWLPPATGKEQ